MDIRDEIRLGVAVGLDDMLAAREARAARQRELLASGAGSLVSFTLNVPGQYKWYPLAEDAFDEGVRVLGAGLRSQGIAVLREETRRLPTGGECFRLVDCDAMRAKRLAMGIEDAHPLGRLFDMDVLGPGGGPVRGIDCGRPERRCIVCGGPVWECARSRAHSAEELSLRTAGFLLEYAASAFADEVAGLATRALLHEVGATPKPGLVDRANNGAHRDMDFFTFVDSAAALAPYFRDAALRGFRHADPPESLLASLRPAGQWAEERMLAATGGVNAHKGAIFTLGIFSAALGLAKAARQPFTPEHLLGLCAAVASGVRDDFRAVHADPKTHGELAFVRHKLHGARGEAARGYPAVGTVAYPVLENGVKNGMSLNDAGVAALLHLLVVVDDTNIVHRRGMETLRAIQDEVAAKLEAERDADALLAFARDLDKRFIEMHISPGGCADLLALAYMLYFVQERFA